MGHTVCDPQVKAQVMAALLAGQSISELAKAYNIPPGTIRAWKFRAKDATATVLRQDATQKKSTAELVRGCLEAILGAVKKIAETVQNEEYIERQSASEVAVLLGVLSDKGFRILEAAERANSEAASQSPAP